MGQGNVDGVMGGEVSQVRKVGQEGGPAEDDGDVEHADGGVATCGK